MLSTLQPYLNPKQLLIEPFERLGFIITFVLVTLIASLGARFVFLNLPLYSVPIENGTGAIIFGETWRTVDAAILGAVFGAIVGASQWLVLRKFVPDWGWIIATTAGWCGFQLTRWAWQNLVIQLLMSGQLSDFSRNPVMMGVALLLSLGISFLATLWLGLLQWLILRKYVRSARWWLFIFPATLLIWACLMSLIGFAVATFSGSLRSGLFSDWSVVFTISLGTARSLIFFRDLPFPAILAIAQATGLCLFQRKLRNTDSSTSINLNPLLTTAPQITNFIKIRDLSDKLYHQIHRSWNPETTLSTDPIYLLGLTADGKIIVCQPADRYAADCMSQTPLPSLINNYSDNDIEQYYDQPLARFLVTFTSVGSLEVRSCRSYKLFWIVLSVLALVLIISTCLSLFMEQSRLRKLNIFR